MTEEQKKKKAEEIMQNIKEYYNALNTKLDNLIQKYKIPKQVKS